MLVPLVFWCSGARAKKAFDVLSSSWVQSWSLHLKFISFFTLLLLNHGETQEKIPEVAKTCLYF